MKDYVIQNISWHIPNDPRGKEVARDLVVAYKPLIAWLKENNLIKNKALLTSPVNENLEIKVSDLTLEGYEIFKLAHDKWLQAFDRLPIGEITDEKAKKKVQSIWEKYYIKLKNGD